MNAKMWCLINTKTKKPITVVLDYNYWDNFYIIGFATKKSLMRAIDDEVNDGEEVKRVDFQY